MNTPALVGGFLSHWLNKRADKTGGERGRTIRERGVIIASGLMAGGALGGVFGAALRLIPGYREELIKTPFYNNEADIADRLRDDVRGTLSVHMVQLSAESEENKGD